jgi:acylpyruvate hydrolase
MRSCILFFFCLCQIYLFFVSDFLPKNAITLEELYGERMWLKVNGKVQQDARIGDMQFKIDELVSYISQYMLLEASDVILCGTPKGVGPIAVGDIIQAGVGHDFLRMQFKVMEKPATNMKSFVIKS